MKHFLSQLVPQGVKNVFYHLPLAVFAAVWFGMPARKLKVIGVTGTNGKTTTTQFIMRILKKAGKKVAMASTINFAIGDTEWVNVSKFTTMSAWKLQKFLRDAVQEGCEYAAIETSSHSIDQYRTFGISYEIAVMTNVTREHLDYHRTMEVYRRAKRKLFERARMAIVNLDMERPEEYLEARRFEKKLSYSAVLPEANIFAEFIEERLSDSTFLVNETSYRLYLPGRYNIENALAAIATGTLLGIAPDMMSAALAEVKGVPGRMEAIPNDRNLHIFIDYAVTPDSLEKLYALVSKMRQGNAKIISVFGACGERDRGKRPLMGEIVSSAADIIVLTNEDPYHEDPKQILHEVATGVRNKTEGENFFTIFDRREAIAKALSLANPDDILLVTGKGAEETMAIGDERLPWSDRRVIGEELKSMEHRTENMEHEA